MDILVMLTIVLACTLALLEYNRCLGSVGISKAISQEICEYETFQADCNPDEVVHITYAQFGHLHLSRCTPYDVHQFGCKADVIAIADDRCTGSSQCQIEMPDPAISKTRPCGTGLPLFMDIKYVCLEGRRSNDPCRDIAVSRIPHYFTTLEAVRSACQSGHTGLHIASLTTEQGLKIRLTTKDPSPHLGNNTYHLRDFLDVEEGKVSVEMNCSVFDDIEVIECEYTSLQNKLNIALKESKANLIISYVATGCLDYRPPAGMWQERSGDNVTVGCYSTDRTWTLQCVGATWVGIEGNCSVKTTVVPSSTNLPQMNSDKNDVKTPNMSKGVMLVTIIASTVLLSALVITAACVYVKCLKSKYHPKAASKTRVQYALSPQDAALLLSNGIQDGAQRNSWHNTMPLPQNNDQHGAARKDYMTMNVLPLS